MKNKKYYQIVASGFLCYFSGSKVYRFSNNIFSTRELAEARIPNFRKSITTPKNEE